jgi:hypothetical protein
MRVLLLVVALLFCGNAWSDGPSDHKAITHKDQKAKQTQHDPKLDTSSLEKAIRESIKEASEKTDPYAGEKIKSDRKLVEYSGQLAYFTNWLVIVATIQACLFVWQLLLINKATKDAGAAAVAATESAQAAKAQSEALVTSNRAWVSYTTIIPDSFSDATVDGITDKKNGVMFIINWINAGRTPAIKCNLFSMYKAIENGTAIPYFTSPAGDSQRQAPLIPGIKVSSRPCYFFDTDIEAFSKGERRFFIYGRINYEDIFLENTPRHTEVCMEVEFGGYRSDNNEMIFNFTAIGPQNSAS